MDDILMSNAMQVLSVISTVLSITVGGGVFMLIFRAGKMTEKLETIEKKLDAQLTKCEQKHEKVDARLHSAEVDIAKHAAASTNNTGQFKPSPAT